ncbi:DNA primase [Malacoplasma penetrans]|uniref:DNA primase n=1 Tax=Malacoplasma penetrans TaxID=28227 RepID=UPI0010139148|nr:DNA primase [Malacoplasma penetrans]RXY96632.1 DNA primase [Malacoplasma penetrans]
MQNNTTNNNWISDLVKSYSIVDVVQHYLQLSKKGNDYKAICPFHADRNPSLSVSPSKNVFKCFTCNTGGDSLRFIMLYKKITYTEAIKEFKTIFNITDPNLDRYINSTSKVNEEDQKIYNANKKASFYYNNTLYAKENIKCLQYLKDRHIDDELIKFYEIGFAPKLPRDYLLNLFESTKSNHNIDNYQLLNAGLVSLTDKNEFIDFFHDRLIIPIKNEFGNIAGFSGRTISPNEKIKYINTKTTTVFQKENILFNLFAFDKTKYEEIFIVEGYMDVFAFRRLGIENVIASMGTAFTINQINIIKKYKNIKRIILCLDNDNAGNEATISLYEKLTKNNFDIFLVRPYSKKFKDVDELSRQLPKEECLKIINDQIGFVEYQIEKLKQMNLSYKDKKIELSSIVDMISDFAYNQKFFTEDKKMICDFFEIDVPELQSLLDEKAKKSIKGTGKNFQNNKNKNFIHFSNELKQAIDSAIDNEVGKGSNRENNLFVEIKNPIKEREITKLKEQEKTLFLNMLFSKELAEMYFKYLGYLVFINPKNEDAVVYRVHRIVIEILRENLKNKTYDVEDICNQIINSDKLNGTHKDFFNGELNRYLKINNLPDIKRDASSIREKDPSFEEKILSEGITLLTELRNHQFKQIIEDKKIEVRELKMNGKLKEAEEKEKEIKLIEKEKKLFNKAINTEKSMH